MTFRFKIVLGVVLIQLFLVSILGWRNLSFLRSTSEIDLNSRASLSAAILAASVGPSIQTQDTQHIKQMINNALAHPGEVYIRVRGVNGILVENGSPQARNHPFQEDFLVDTINDGIFDVTAEVFAEDRVIGHVEMGFSTNPIDKMMGAAYRNTATISVIGILISALFSLLLGNYFNAQLKRLRNATRRIASGDVGHQIGITGNDEIAQTASAFNTMSRRLAKMYAEKQAALNDARDKATNLLVSQRRVEAVLQNAMDGIITLNESGVIETFNPAAERIFAYSSDEAIGQAITILMSSASEIKTSDDTGLHFDINQLNLHGKPREIDGMRKDGSSFAMELAISEFSIEGQRQFIGMIRDISDRKAAEIERRKARDLEMELSRNKFEFIANVSRDIRGPINHVIEKAAQLRETSLDERQAKLLGQIRSSSYSLITIISDVLDFSRIAAGNMALEHTPFSLYRTIEITYHRAKKRLALKKKALLLCYFLPANTPCTLRGDPTRLRQVLFNLIDNAVAHTNKGEILIRIGVIDTSDDTVRLHFEISDSGKGIDTHRQAHIFNIIQPAGTTLIQGQAGSGLGLNISRKLVEMMGGKIGVISTPGMGSTFWFEITLDKQQPQITTKNSAENAELEDIRVLIVTSGRSQDSTLPDKLQSLGMDVHIVEDGNHALQALFDADDGDLPFQLLIFDVSMTGTHCLRLARAVSSDDRTTRVRLIMITTTGYRGDSEEVRRAGISGYLTAPVETQQLHECIRAVLQGERDILVTRHSLAVGKPHQHGLLLLIDNNPDEQKHMLSRLEAMDYCVELAEDCTQGEHAIQHTSYDAILMCGSLANDMIGRDWDTTVNAGDTPPPPFIVLVSAALPEETKQKCAQVNWQQLMLPATDMALLEALNQPERP